MKNRRMSLVIVMLVLASAMLFAADGYISREKAMEIALADAGVEKGQASFVRSHLDRDDGRMIYDVEFYVADMESTARSSPRTAMRSTGANGEGTRCP